MKKRLTLVMTALVLLATLGASMFLPTAPVQAEDSSSSNTYAYNNAQFDAIQGPNPYHTADSTPTATWRKVTKIGKGVYIAVDAPFSSNSGGYCYPAIQTSSKKYDGAKTGSMYLSCASPDVNNPEGSKTSITIATFDQNTLQKPAQDACQGKSGQELQGCMAGFNGSANGKSVDDSCKGFSGSGLSACQAAWNGKQGNNGDDSATCEDQGGPLAWIMCPIFNEMSNASQYIFQNIVQPFLITPPVSTDPADPSFQIWSNLRIYGDIFLIIALLVIVFGESIGGGLIDAYTAKKVLPRLLVAAVLINLSIYLVAFLVDFSNILGKGVGSILTAPLTHCQGAAGNCWDFQLTTGDQARVFSVGIIGLMAGGTAVAGLLGVLFTGGFTAVLTMAFFVLLPMFFAVLAVFITLIFRKGLILMLVLVSPVAFAMYCLPNTQRFFKRWWELLLEALLVYPIIVAIFGVAEILSVTILTANGISASDLQGSGASDFFAGNLNRTLSLVVAFLLQFLPLLAIPFAFRFAGSAMGRIYEAATGAGQRINKLADNRREHAKRDYQSQALSARGRMYHGALAAGASDKSRLGVRRRASQFAANRAGGYNIEGLLSAARAEKMKMLDDQIATGRDEEIRGLTVDKKTALAGRGVQKLANGTYQDIATKAAVSEGQLSKYDYQVGSNGARSFQSLGGQWVAEQDVDAGHSRWGRDQFAQQGALSYEMRKSVSEGQTQHLAENYNKVAKDGWGMSDEEAAGAWIGSAFANQNQHVEFKHTDWKTGKLKEGGKGLVDEVFENKGSYQLSQMNSNTVEQLRNAYRHANTPDATGKVDEETKKKIQSVAETFMSRYGGGSRVAGMQGDGDNQVPDIRPVQPGQSQSAENYQTNSQGSAHMAERVRSFAEEVGVYRPLDESGDTHSAGPPPANQRHN